MSFIRIPVPQRLVCAAVAVAMLTSAAMPAHAQLINGNRNGLIRTSADLSGGKLRPRINRLPGLNFSTLGLFGDAEVFPQFKRPRPFVFALPNFSGAGLDFTGVRFPDYLTLVANSYGLTDSDSYKNRFLFSNSFSVANNRNLFGFYGDLQRSFNLFLTDRNAFFNANPQLDASTRIRFTLDPNALPSALNDAAFNRIHSADFLAGGGFLPFSPPTIPTPPQSKTDTPKPFVPFVPVRPGPLGLVGGQTDGATGGTQTAASASSDTASAAMLAAEIVPSTPGLNTDLGSGIVLPTSASQPVPTTAAVVSSVVPEPATLGLLTLGATALLTRSRRR